MRNESDKPVKPRRYTDEERKFLTEIVPGRSYAQIAEEFNARFSPPSPPITTKQVSSFVGNNKLNTGRNGQFQKGQVPPNKGKYSRHSPATEFKKGNIPHNYKPIGSIRIIRDGYKEIKVADPNKWQLMHRVIWEKTHGTIPKDHVIIFADGNIQNLCIENLLCITRNQLARLNQNKLIGKTKELTETGLLVADLITKIHERKKGKEQDKTNQSR